MGIGGGAVVMGRARERESGSRLADQDGNRVLILRPQNAQVGQRGLGRLQSGPRFHDRELIADAGVVLGLGQVQRLLIVGDGLVEELDQRVLSADLEIEIRPDRPARRDVRSPDPRR